MLGCNRVLEAKQSQIKGARLSRYIFGGRGTRDVKGNVQKKQESGTRVRVCPLMNILDEVFRLCGNLI